MKSFLPRQLDGWARRLGVPVPEAAFYRGPDGASWLSELIQPALHWDNRFASQVDNIDGFGATLALDAIIHNEDRHAGNLLVQPEINPLHARIWAIDHGHATVGWPDTFRDNVKEIPGIQNLARGLPIDLLAEPAARAAEKATAFTQQAIMAMVRGACLLTQETKADVIGQTLLARCVDAKALVAAYVKRIRESSR